MAIDGPISIPGFSRKGLTLALALLLGMIASNFGAARQTPTPASRGEDVAIVRGLVKNVSNLVDYGPPVGVVMAYAGTKEADLSGGWLVCDGRPLKRADYEDLHNAIGVVYGDGSRDPRTGQEVTGYDFNLPDYRGRFLRGVDRGSQRDPGPRGPELLLKGRTNFDGVGTVEDQATGRPKLDYVVSTVDTSHSHTYSDAYYAEIGGPEGNRGLLGSKGNSDRDNGRIAEDRATSITPQSHTHTITTGGDPETRPVNVAVNWIIRARTAPPK